MKIRSFFSEFSPSARSLSSSPISHHFHPSSFSFFHLVLSSVSDVGFLSPSSLFLPRPALATLGYTHAARRRSKDGGRLVCFESRSPDNLGLTQPWHPATLSADPPCSYPWVTRFFFSPCFLSFQGTHMMQNGGRTDRGAAAARGETSRCNLNL